MRNLTVLSFALLIATTGCVVGPPVENEREKRVERGMRDVNHDHKHHYDHRGPHDHDDKYDNDPMGNYDDDHDRYHNNRK